MTAAAAVQAMQSNQHWLPFGGRRFCCAASAGMGTHPPQRSPSIHGRCLGTRTRQRYSSGSDLLTDPDGLQTKLFAQNRHAVLRSVLPSGVPKITWQLHTTMLLQVKGSPLVGSWFVHVFICYSCCYLFLIFDFLIARTATISLLILTITAVVVVRRTLYLPTNGFVKSCGEVSAESSEQHWKVCARRRHRR